jgi:hypothetical protein
MPSDTPSNITIGTTNVSLNNIRNAFMGTTTRLSHYYKGGSFIYNTTRLSTIPTSGPISFGNFKNTTNVIMVSENFTSPSLSNTLTSTTTTTFNLDLSTSNIIKITSIPSITFTFTSITTRTTVLNQMTTFVPYINSTQLTSSTSTYIDNPNTSYYVWIFYYPSNIPLITSNNAINIRSSAVNNIPPHSAANIKISIIYIK